MLQGVSIINLAGNPQILFGQPQDCKFGDKFIIHGKEILIIKSSFDLDSFF